ncbi:MAG: glycogen synthase GlgA [bacterium]|nr:glycogen synthase GlgA [bacterium]
MNILFATSEATPFAKTGGLADVCGALPVALNKIGCNSTLFMPAFRQVKQSGHDLRRTDISFDIPIGSKIVHGRLLQGEIPDSDVTVYFVEQDDYYDRDELYREHGRDFSDNCERFAFFCRAVLESVRLLELPVDVFHCHDWQTGLIPAYLKIEYAEAAGYENIASLLTIHNLAYQGNFWHWDMLLTGLDWKYFNWQQMEFFGGLSLLKTGMIFSDSINTVSPTYAEEIMQPGIGCGLEGVLSDRREDVCGIINGIDESVWNPANDDHLPYQYSVDNWREGKAACKASLQQKMGLPIDADAPVVGLIGRLADQKGWNLTAEVMERWASHENVQWVILGSGEPHYHELLQRLSQYHGDRVAVRLGFSDELAHQIEAGADLFVMPSQYEPCGLNQLYSLKYGAVPVVRNTGGLSDTVVNVTDQTLAGQTATGFSFDNFDSESLEDALRRAITMWRERPDQWAQIVTTGMKQDWSWEKSAQTYHSLYEKLIARHRGE